MNPQSLEQGLGLIRAILAGHAGDGLAPLPPTGQGAPGMAAGAPATMPPANGSVSLPQPAGTAPSPALGLSFLAPTGVAPDPTNMMQQPGPPGNPPAGGISICLHLSPETVAGLMGAVMHLLGGVLGGGAQKPANPAPPTG